MPDERFLVFGQPEILDDEIAEVVACLRSGWIGTGPLVDRFERDFAAFTGAAHAAAVASCSAGIHLSLLAANLPPDAEVLTSALTFCGAVHAVVHAGARPVPVDIDPATLNLDPRQAAARITPRTRAILVVHFAGRPCDMDAIEALARAHDLIVVEDCAHAIEARYRGRAAGTIGDFGCFSFYATKNVTTGEGGMVIAGRQADVERIRRLALHGLSADAWARAQEGTFRHTHAVEIGFKYNMTDLQAAIGIHQLRRVESRWQRRQAIWRRYSEALRNGPVALPPEPAADSRHAHHLYTIQVSETRAGISRDAFLDAMTRRGIGVGVHYPSIAEHPIYQSRFGWRPEDWPAAMRVGRETVSLPLSPSLSDEDVERVVAVVKEVVAPHARL